MKLRDFSLVCLLFFSASRVEGEVELVQFHFICVHFGRAVGSSCFVRCGLQKHQHRLHAFFFLIPFIPLNTTCAGGLRWFGERRGGKEEEKKKKRRAKNRSPRRSPSLPSNLLLSIFLLPSNLGYGGGFVFVFVPSFVWFLEKKKKKGFSINN